MESNQRRYGDDTEQTTVHRWQWLVSAAAESNIAPMMMMP